MQLIREPYFRRDH